MSLTPSGKFYSPANALSLIGTGLEDPDQGLLGHVLSSLSKCSLSFLFPRFPPALLLLHSKSGDLEEELKNVTNNLKSLEAQAEKVL